MILPYGIQTFSRADLPKVRLLNQFVEKVPTSRAGMALLARPGLAPYLTLGSGPIRGMFQQPGALDGDLFTVSGTKLFRGSVEIGTIPGADRVSMSATLDVLMIANDIGLYASDGATVTTIDFPEYPNVDHPFGASSVGYINGITFASHSDTRRLYFTQDPYVWDDLDYISAETSTGKIIAAVVVSDQVWVFCEKVTEIFVTTGDGTSPLQRIEGRLYDKGCLARDTIVKMDNSVIWVGHDKLVYRGDSVPTRISDHGIEQSIQDSDPANLRAWWFPWIGHTFYCLTTDDGTLPYDASTQQWTEFGSYERQHWRAHLGLQYDQIIVAGDDEAGKLWRLDGAYFHDDEEPIQRINTGIVDQAGFIDNIVLDCSVGMEPTISGDPIIELRISRDQGMTWGPWKQANIGMQGQYRARAAWRTLGLVDGDGALIHWRITDRTPWRLSAIKMNEPMGGRSR